ncbi:hypothetical protein GYA13_04305, partial [Candidatus Kuenenbacteria bacterium]|nr:hypothetical protein [Candidatus Kuenenbacteria bacterium]
MPYINDGGGESEKCSTSHQPDDSFFVFSRHGLTHLLMPVDFSNISLYWGANWTINILPSWLIVAGQNFADLLWPTATINSGP